MTESRTRTGITLTEAAQRSPTIEQAILEIERRNMPFPDDFSEWVVFGRMPTSQFIQALIKNDFTGFYSFADEAQQARAADWSRFLFNAMPQTCLGQDNVEDWAIRGGLTGTVDDYEDPTD